MLVIIFSLLLSAGEAIAYGEGLTEDSDIYEPVVTEAKKDWSADFLWEELSKYSPNDEITAGIMGYFYKESFFRSNAVTGWIHFNTFRRDPGDICIEVTKLVDAGLKDDSSREYFTVTLRHKYGGYGLGQWCTPEYLNRYYDFIQEKEGSISDAKLQCEFVVKDMRAIEKLWNKLMEAKTAEECGRIIGTLYDGSTVPEIVAMYANKFYKEYVK
jgi:hypothetical protein